MMEGDHCSSLPSALLGRRMVGVLRKVTEHSVAVI